MARFSISASGDGGDDFGGFDGFDNGRQSVGISFGNDNECNCNGSDNDDKDDLPSAAEALWLKAWCGGRSLTQSMPGLCGCGAAACTPARWSVFNFGKWLVVYDGESALTARPAVVRRMLQQQQVSEHEWLQVVQELNAVAERSVSRAWLSLMKLVCAFPCVLHTHATRSPALSRTSLMSAVPAAAR